MSVCISLPKLNGGAELTDPSNVTPAFLEMLSAVGMATVCVTLTSVYRLKRTCCGQAVTLTRTSLCLEPSHQTLDIYIKTYSISMSMHLPITHRYVLHYILP